MLYTSSEYSGCCIVSFLKEKRKLEHPLIIVTIRQTIVVIWVHEKDHDGSGFQGLVMGGRGDCRLTSRLSEVRYLPARLAVMNTTNNRTQYRRLNWLLNFRLNKRESYNVRNIVKIFNFGHAWPAWPMNKYWLSNKISPSVLTFCLPMKGQSLWP